MAKSKSWIEIGLDIRGEYYVNGCRTCQDWVEIGDVSNEKIARRTAKKWSKATGWPIVDKTQEAK